MINFLGCTYKLNAYIIKLKILPCFIVRYQHQRERMYLLSYAYKKCFVLLIADIEYGFVKSTPILCQKHSNMEGRRNFPICYSQLSMLSLNFI